LGFSRERGDIHFYFDDIFIVEAWSIIIAIQDVTFMYWEKRDNWFVPFSSSGGGNSGGGTGGNAGGLFEGPGLTDDDLAILEELLEDIINDCMGGALYNGLIAKLNGKKLSIEIDPNSGGGKYDFVDDKIILGTRDGGESSILLHEMFHAYQGHGMNSATYFQSAMNFELEAHIAQYMYVRKLSKFKPGNFWYNLFSEGGGAYGHISRLVGDFLTPQGELQPNTCEEQFKNRFGVSANRMKNNPMSPYADDKYKYNSGISGNNNIKHIREFAKDC
jgi:hypothetical protein